MNLCEAFYDTLARAGIYPVSTMKKPLQNAIECDDAGAVTGILDKCPGAVHAGMDALTPAPFRFALSLEKFAAAGAILAAAPSVLKDRDYFGRTALIDMAGRLSDDDEKTLKILQALTDAGAAVNDQDKDGRSALHWAAGRKTPGAARFLLDKDAAIEARDKWGSAPLMMAAGHGCIDTMALLLGHGANLHATSDSGCNAVTAAILWSKFDAALWLMKQGAVVDFGAKRLDDSLKNAAEDKDGDFLAAFRAQKTAWEKLRQDSEIDNAVYDIEGGLLHPMQVRTLRLKKAAPSG